MIFILVDDWVPKTAVDPSQMMTQIASKFDNSRLQNLMEANNFK